MNSKKDKSEFELKLERKAAEEAARKARLEAESAEIAAAEATEPASDEGDPAPAKAILQETPDANRELEERRQECEQLKDQLLRVRADFDNYRKRALRDMDQLRKSASLALIRALLPALDNLERALSHADAGDKLAEGVRMVHKQFSDILAGEGLAPIPALNEIFDPNVHDALATMSSSSIEAGRVMEEYERGYRLGDQVVRPARVIVSNGPETTDVMETGTPDSATTCEPSPAEN